MSSAKTIRALITRTKGVSAQVETLPVIELPLQSTVKNSPGECNLLVKVKYSSLNYKDALVVSGKYPGLKPPMIGGIDIAGTVQESKSDLFKEGDEVIMNGWGVGTDHYGGFAQLASLRSEWAMKMPKGLDALGAAQIGTGGYTAMLCVDALVRNGVKPEHGPILVTGSTGGVGSISIAILADLGYKVTAVSGKTSSTDWLKSLGATDVKARSDFEAEGKPLVKEQWAGCVDTVGGNVLANVLSGTKYGGSVAACGLAGGMNLPTTVAPFILRGVSLLGVESALLPVAKREEVYGKYAEALIKSKKLDKVCEKAQLLTLEQVPDVAEKMLKGQIEGRYCVTPE
ncbi:hypothetical protein TCAL_01251 [Tigriopus californicus]|uniref:Enoyl reductase (ER) domain-containing protein n=1 Tax=Tigriopus californicus TaxID=6832 RepID=A0A553NZU8_TIGCA|nr:probable acrylyl-CoA reductase AcuI [Tigriopus californicus]TRY70947.1 hypothetical protein TCAL_01251 [Tigriopus californicus]|eukprot:TCALIF_01251-PA protein Name:"Similar to acuI Probable acrylyl-CoA reductase AcuI (Escherichia coli (strain K12))" AED:0.02 eAED:0.02 QI:108/1/1/1/0/0.5/2/22/342